jgi:cell division protein FtsA
LGRKTNYITGLDIGTTKICCVLAQVIENQEVQVLAVSQSDSKGLRKGVVVNMEETVESIKTAVEEAESRAGFPIESVHVGVSGDHIRGFNSRGVVPIRGKHGEIGGEDIRRVVEAARAVTIPPDRETLHVIPQEFIIDGQDGIYNPTGMTGTRLEVNVHLVTSSISNTQNVVTSINHSGMTVENTILQQLASAESVLSRDEKELGCVVVDIGGGTSDVAIYNRNAVWHTAVLPLGGNHITKDIAVGLRTPIQEAERIKKSYACVLPSLLQNDDTLEVPSVGGRLPRVLSRKILCEIVQPRAEEILNLILQEVKRAGFEKQLVAGAILTGGGSMLEGLMELAEQVLDMPVRRGNPREMNGLPDSFRTPTNSTAIGLVQYGLKSRTNQLYHEVRPQNSHGIFSGVLGGVRGWFVQKL